MNTGSCLFYIGKEFTTIIHITKLKFYFVCLVTLISGNTSRIRKNIFVYESQNYEELTVTRPLRWL